jgi:cytochrome c oxidase cbb3-type subunit 3
MLSSLRFIVALCLLVAIAFRSECRAEPSRPDSTPPAQPEAGTALYAKYCLLCHGANLEGYRADNAPSLASPTFRATASDAFLHAAIERGRPGTSMAGYGRSVSGPLEPAEIDALISYIRGGAAAPAPLLPKRSRGSPTSGARVYAANCQSCHGTVEQRGNAVHLANAMFLATASDAYLRAAIVGGRPGTAMPPWSSTLSAPDIENVIAYLRSLARPLPPPIALPAPLFAERQGPSIENVAIVVNPNGEQADLTLRDGRYASVADVAKAYQEHRRLVLVDARTTSDYVQLHIAGAISIPYFDMHDLAKIPNDGTWIITYCACPHHVSGIVMEELRKRGYAHAAVLDEGIFVWQQQGNPVVAAAGQLPIPAPPPPLAMPKSLGPVVDEPSP